MRIVGLGRLIPPNSATSTPRLPLQSFRLLHELPRHHSANQLGGPRSSSSTLHLIFGHTTCPLRERGGLLLPRRQHYTHSAARLALCRVVPRNPRGALPVPGALEPNGKPFTFWVSSLQRDPKGPSIKITKGKKERGQKRTGYTRPLPPLFTSANTIYSRAEAPEPSPGALAQCRRLAPRRCPHLGLI